MQVESSFAARLRAAREKLGISAGRLSEAAGLSRVEVAHLEAEMQEPNVGTCTALAAALQLDPGELAFGDMWGERGLEGLDFVGRLKWAREERGMSQRVLSARASLQPPYIGKLERSEIAPDRMVLSTHARIARALSVHPGWLVYGP